MHSYEYSYKYVSMKIKILKNVIKLIESNVKYAGIENEI